MAHVLVPFFPPVPSGARKSDYAPVKQRPRTRYRRASDKGKARAGDNSGSNEQMHVHQNAFKSNWYGPGGANLNLREKGKKGRKKKPANEIVVVVDNEDESEGKKEKENASLSTSLDQAAFSLNSANPNVAATASTSAPVTSGSMRRLRRVTCAESLSDSASMEVVITSPTKRPRTHTRAQAALNRNNNHSPVTKRRDI